LVDGIEGGADHVHLVEVVVVPVVAHDVVLVVVGGELVHFSDVFSLSFVHVGEIAEDGPLKLFGGYDFEHLAGDCSLHGVAVLALDDFLSLGVVEAGEVFVIDVFDVDPLYLEVALELEGVVLPPEGEGLLVVA